MSEYWDIYDENKNKTNQVIKRGNPFAEGEYYVCCEIWIMDVKSNCLLVTQRHPGKRLGGMWEFVGGGVLAGETTSQAAVREVKEEVGIEITEEKLTLIDTYKKKNYFMDVYLLRINVKKEELSMQPEEVVDARLVSEMELNELINDGVFVNSVAGRYSMYKDKIKWGNRL